MIFTIKILINTAFIVSSLQVVNQALVNSAQPREQFFGIQVTSFEQVMIFAGGIPLQRHNSTLGIWLGQVQLTPTRLEARSSSLRN